MKKIVQLLLIVAMLFSVSTVAYSAPGLYIGGNFGLAFLNETELDSYDYPNGSDVNVNADNGLSFGGVVGYAFENGYRIEGEVDYQKNDFDKMEVSYLGVSETFFLKGNITSLAVFVNGYYDFKNESRVTPFIGAGLGFANIAVSDYNYADSALAYDEDERDDDTVFAYQFSAGVGFEVTESITLDLRYRYVATENVEIDGATLDYSSNIISTGIRFSF